MVPLTPDVLFIDVFALWKAPVILCASTTLGTINHTLLSIEALRQRHIPILGIAFIGPSIADTEHIIESYSRVPILGRLPWLNPLTKDSLANTFATHFRHKNFQQLHAHS
jgi:dethiobiotin synthetase